MQFLRNIVDKTRRLYHPPGSKLHKLWPLFDANETFLFAPDTKAQRTGPHVRDYADLKRTMVMVIFAMLPCLLFSFYNVGYQHFLAFQGMEPRPSYELGWLQSLLGATPDLANVTFWDRVVFGLQRMIPILIVSYAVGLGIEVGFAILRKEEVSEGYLV
ncbi:MAG: RnfABCDGE type electron transport complex subunit D, partial [Planctomycetes bacterium]|nr:RnfABCDGE type electron transport complex subunit D [Planctomycetota bacterium]